MISGKALDAIGLDEFFRQGLIHFAGFIFAGKHLQDKELSIIDKTFHAIDL